MMIRTNEALYCMHDGSIVTEGFGFSLFVAGVSGMESLHHISDPIVFV